MEPLQGSLGLDYLVPRALQKRGALGYDVLRLRRILETITDDSSSGFEIIENGRSLGLIKKRCNRSFRNISRNQSTV